jgi:ketosteroid isomerase-like protein
VIERLAALVVDESKWLPFSMGLAILAVVVLLRRQRRSKLAAQPRAMAAMSLFFGLTIATMALGHLAAVTTKLALGTLEGSRWLLYAIGIALAVPAGWLIHHALRLFGSEADHGRGSLVLNAWLAATLLALGLHNLPLAVPGFLNVGYQLLAGTLARSVIVGLSVVANLGLFVGSLVFLASGQSFEQFTGIEAAPPAAQQTTKASVGEPIARRQVAALLEMTRAVNAGDAAAYARLYALDAVITIHGSGVLSGRDAIQDHESELLREFPGARLAFHSVWQDGLSAAVHYAVNGRTASGQSMGHEGLLFYRFAPSGLIESESRYLDSLTPMAQLDVIGPPARALPRLRDGLESLVVTRLAKELDNVATARAWLAALDAEDEAAFLSRVAEDAVLDEMIDAGPLVGRPRLKAWFKRWTGAFSGATTELSNVLGVGDFVLVETVLRGTLTGPLGRVRASNDMVTLHRALILRVTDGKLARITAFMNGKELAQAAGQWPLPAGD